MNTQSLKIVDIYLDPENPRHDPIVDKQEIIEQLVKHEKIDKLAADIAKNGLSPLDLIGVMKSDNNVYIVLEGNRRICALLLLNDPELAPENKRGHFRKLSKKFQIPDEVTCYVFENKEDANEWIEKRHNGQQDGVGLTPWNATQKSRFFKNSENALAFALLQYCVDENIISEEERNTASITTFSRYLSNPIFRNTFAITTNRKDEHVKLTMQADDFKKVMSYFMKDLLDGTEITSRSKKVDWERYANSLVQNGIASTERCEEYLLSDRNKKNSVTTNADNINTLGEECQQQNSQPNNPMNQVKNTTSSTKINNNTTAITTRDNQSPNKRKYLISRDFALKTSDMTLKRVYDELKKLECDQYPLSTALLCRVFLEIIFKKTYEKIFDKKPGGQKAHVIIQKIIQHIEKKENELPYLNIDEKAALQALKKLPQQTTNPLSFHELGNLAHGAYYPTNSTQIKTEWDNISSIIIHFIRLMNE